jgi:hypothetical protein
MGYANPDREMQAITVLSARISVLGAKKFAVGVVACQFVGAFSRLVKTGGYYNGMPVIPSMLLKPGNWQKVFAMVANTLYHKGDYGDPWRKTWEKAVEEAKIDQQIHVPEQTTEAYYAQYGISLDDPARFQKLQAARKGVTA